MNRNGTCIIFTHVHVYASCVQYTTLVVQEHACSNNDGDLRRYVASSLGSLLASVH